MKGSTRDSIRTYGGIPHVVRPCKYCFETFVTTAQKGTVCSKEACQRKLNEEQRIKQRACVKRSAAKKKPMTAERERALRALGKL